VAEIAPQLADRLKLGERNQRTIPFTLTELKAIREKAGKAMQQARTGLVRNSLRHVTDLTTQALDRSRGVGAIPAAERLYQFRITLLGIQPAIWRRIQVKDCTLDKLHEHIQTALGWTNSHLHDFKIGGKDYGDPLLLDENFVEFDYGDSTTTKLSDILPKTGKRFRFEYQYDCPPEDVGGTGGYEEFLEAIADPEHERHDEYLTWIGGRFDPEAFDAEKATKRMRRGLPDWRSERWM
jgi:hypothetical protein